MLTRLRKFTLASSLAGLCAAAAIGGVTMSRTEAAGETRTLSMVHVHTGEKLTITYKKDGRYIPSALARINYFMRDWRRNAVTTIDPRTVDLMWELYADLGSRQPIRIICGYRSAQTNGMLKRIGRNVASKSQHTTGRAIDLYFPDVPLSKLRNSAIVREVGGVGYYPAGDGGFIHIDTGSVRYWPRPSDSQIAQIFRDYKGTIGARLRGGDTLLASREVPEPETSTPGKKPALDSAKLASLSETEAEGEAPAPATVAVLPRPRPLQATAAALPDLPLPRPRPAEVLAAAAARVVPVSAEPPADVNFATSGQANASLMPQLRAAALEDGPTDQSNLAAKGEPIRTASLSQEELTVIFERLQDQDARDDELQDVATKGGPVSNVMAKSDRLPPGDMTGLATQHVHSSAMSDPLFAADKPLPFN